MDMPRPASTHPLPLSLRSAPQPAPPEGPPPVGRGGAGLRGGGAGPGWGSPGNTLLRHPGSPRHRDAKGPPLPGAWIEDPKGCPTSGSRLVPPGTGIPEDAPSHPPGSGSGDGFSKHTLFLAPRWYPRTRIPKDALPVGSSAGQDSRGEPCELHHTG